MMSNAATAQKTNEQIIKVSKEQLPLSCPQPEEDVWNMHPRVYFPLDKSGEAVCPYCGARYVLQD